MKQDICTIPVNEIFDVKDGCPICRMRGELEKRSLEFIMGAAMMEPDVRHETNRLGFCPDHFSKMLKMGNRLSLALMLESHLMKIDEDVFEHCKQTVLRGPAKSAEESSRNASSIFKSCYVCDNLNRSMDQEMGTFFKMWTKNPEFRLNVATQPFYCLNDYAYLIEKGQKLLDKKRFPEFYDAMTKVTRAGLKTLTQDMTAFCKLYDFHNSGADAGSLRDSVKHAISFLTACSK